MLLACTACSVFYVEEPQLDVCPCGGRLFYLDDSRVPDLVARGFRPGIYVEIGPGQHKELFGRLSGAEVTGAKLLQGHDGGRPAVQYLELNDGSRIWLTAGQGVAAIHSLTSYGELHE